MNRVQLVWFILLLSAVSFSWSDVRKKDNICQSEGCHQAAEQILNNMDRNVDPCEDFYQFSCGNFMAEIGEESGLDRMISAVNKTLERISSKQSYFMYLKQYMKKCHTSSVYLFKFHFSPNFVNKKKI